MWMLTICSITNRGKSQILPTGSGMIRVKCWAGEDFEIVGDLSLSSLSISRPLWIAINA